jgi:hypothetical protein
MSKPTIHGNRRTLSASNIREAIAADLMQIKTEDRLTFADIGRVLGKSEDQAAKYCEGTASMCAETYVFAREEWNGRFTGSVDALLAKSRHDTTSDRSKATIITKALLEISSALEDDDEASPEEIRARRKSLEGARDAIDGFLKRLSVRAA